MADPLSVAASVAGLISLGFDVAKGLYKVADGVGSAGREVRVYAHEIDTFSKLLGHVRAQLLGPSAKHHDHDDMIKDILNVCDRILSPLQRLQRRLAQLLTHFGQSSSKVVQLGLRVQWIFSAKDKVLWLRGVLAVQQRLLDTILEMMILQSTQDRSVQNIQILQISLVNSVSGVAEVLNSGQLPSLPGLTGSTQQLLANGFSDPRQISGLASTRNHSSALVAPPGRPDADIDRASRDIEQAIDAEVEASGQYIWEDTRALSRRVVRQAETVLQQVNTNRYDRYQSVDTSGNHANYYRGGSTSPSDSSQPSPTMSADTRSTASSASSVSPTSRSDKRRLTERGAWLKFENFDGKLYEIPRASVETPKQIQQYIATLMPQDSDRKLSARRLFQAGHYDLVGEQGEILLLEFWSDLVWMKNKVSLRFRHEATWEPNKYMAETLDASRMQATIDSERRWAAVTKETRELEDGLNALNAQRGQAPQKADGRWNKFKNKFT